MSVDVPLLGKVPNPVEDERDAIMSLLGLHSGSATGNSTESHSSSHEGDDAEESEQSDDDESETGVASPVLKRHEDDSSTGSEAEKKRPRTTTSSYGTARPVYNHLDLSRRNNMGLPLRRIGKKRKHHASVDGQFEDAQESFLHSLASPYPAMSPAQSSKYQDRSVPPPPPHLIQQTSNEFGTHAQKSAELARHALAYQHRAMMAETNGLYPSSRIPAMMPSSNMAEMYERRIHMEAMMAFQAKMHFARQAGPPGIPPPITGIPGAPISAPYGAAAVHRRTGSSVGGPPHLSRPEASRGSETDDDDSAKIGFAMRPPSSPQAHRVESEDEDDDPYKRDVPPTNQNRKPRNTIPFSTKERYERYTPPPSWGKLIKVPKMPPVPGDDKVKNPITEIHENDVLLGRGGLTNTNPGNIKFRKLVSKYRVHYCTAPKGDKGALARYLCNYVRAMHGRFLAKAPDDPSWYEVGDDKAVSKCGQALREGTAEFNRKETESFGTNV